MSKIDHDLSRIKAFVFDVDGVLSPNTISVSPTGEPLRMANVKDGYALQLALKLGYTVAIITGGNSASVRTRFLNLGVPYIYTNARIKTDAFQDLLKRSSLNPEDILYMGDDIPDLEVMNIVGLPVCPADAAPEIKAISTYISPYAGGYGCGRDVIEQVLKAHGKWMSDLSFCW